MNLGRHGRETTCTISYKLALVEEKLFSLGRDKLLRVVSMLVRLCKPSGTGTGTGTGTGALSDLSDRA